MFVSYADSYGPTRCSTLIHLYSVKRCITYSLWKPGKSCHNVRGTCSNKWPCYMLLVFKRLKNASAAQNRQLLNPFDHQVDSVSFSFHIDPKKINPELNELTGHISYSGTYTWNHIWKCSKHHNVTDVLRANSEKNLALNSWWSNSAVIPLH